MKTIRIFGILGTLAMSIALLNGFINGDFFKDGSVILTNPWGIVSLVDLYVGFILFSLWIGYREDTLLKKVVWIALMMVLGFFTASLYVLILSLKEENLNAFIHGLHASKYKRVDTHHDA